MDVIPVLESLARLLPDLPEQAVEDQLVIFDSLLAVSDPGGRPAGAQLLRNAADASPDGGRRNRLFRAADAVAAGQPCARTPDGLSASQAAAAQTVSLADWEARAAQPPVASDAEDDFEEPGEPDYMEDAPPKLPPLGVRYFFPGMVLRVGRGFADTSGRALCEGDLLKILTCERAADGGYLLNLYSGSVRLNGGAEGQQAIIENARNAWLQPVPSIGCLQDLWECIDRELSEAADDEDEDSDDDDLAALREEVELCEDWLFAGEDRGPAPKCEGWRLAAEIFGRDHRLTVWIRLLFAGVAAASKA